MQNFVYAKLMLAYVFPCVLLGQQLASLLLLLVQASFMLALETNSGTVSINISELCYVMYISNKLLTNMYKLFTFYIQRFTYNLKVI